MVTRDIIQRLLAIINETRSRVNTLESKENVLLTATQTLTNKTLTTPIIGSLSGGTAANDDLTLQGTTNATRTTSYVIMQPNGGLVGIGTTSPMAKLHVRDNSTTDIEIARFDSSGDAGATQGKTYLGLHHWSAGTHPSARIGVEEDGLASFDSSLVFQTRNSASDVVPSTRMVINKAGNVCIGTTNPAGKLGIDAKTGVASPGSIALSIRDDSSPTFGFDFNLEGVSTGDMSIMRTILSVQSQVMTFQRATGNVGIGTTSPGRKLHVAGTIIVDGDEGGIAGTVGFTDVSDLAIRSTGVGTIKFDDGTNRDSSGFIKIYIGTTAYYVPVFSAI